MEEINFKPIQNVISGCVYYVSFKNNNESGDQKRRPVLIVNGDTTKYGQSITCFPLTSQNKYFDVLPCDIGKPEIGFIRTSQLDRFTTESFIDAELIGQIDPRIFNIALEMFKSILNHEMTSDTILLKEHYLSWFSKKFGDISKLGYNQNIATPDIKNRVNISIQWSSTEKLNEFVDDYNKYNCAYINSKYGIIERNVYQLVQEAMKQISKRNSDEYKVKQATTTYCDQVPTSSFINIENKDVVKTEEIIKNGTVTIPKPKTAKTKTNSSTTTTKKKTDKPSEKRKYVRKKNFTELSEDY